MYNPPCREKTINLVINLLGKHLRKTPIAIGTRVTKIFGEIRWWHQTSKFCPNSQSWFPMVWNSWTDSKKSNDSSYCRILPMGWSNMLPKFWRSSSSSHIFRIQMALFGFFSPCPDRGIQTGIQTFYWTVLSRTPTADECTCAAPQVAPSRDLRKYHCRKLVVVLLFLSMTILLFLSYLWINSCPCVHWNVFWYNMIWYEKNNMMMMM